MRFTPNSILSITVVSVLPLCAIGAQGQVIMPQPADSAATEMLHEVTVTGSRHSGEVVRPQTLRDGYLATLNAHSVADAVRYFAGVQLKDYGGVGGIKTLDIRSMGTNHMGVFYDGLPVGNAQNGQVDLGRFSLDNIEEIALYNGQKSTIFQPARDFASSGSIYIRSRRPRFPSGRNTAGTVVFRTGSFGLLNPSLRIDRRISRQVSATFNVEYTYSTGRYRFRYSKYLPDGRIAWDTTAVRRNGDIRALRAEASVFGNVDKGSWMAKAYYYNSERGIPGAIVNNVWKNSQRQWDRNFFVQGRFRREYGGNVEIMVNGKYARDHMRYLNPDTTLMLIDNTFDQNELYLSATARYSPFRFWDIAVAADWQYNTLDSDMALFVFPSRHQLLGSVATALNFGGLRLRASLLANSIHDRTRPSSSAGSRRHFLKFTPAVFVLHRHRKCLFRPGNVHTVRHRRYMACGEHRHIACHAGIFGGCVLQPYCRQDNSGSEGQRAVSVDDDESGTRENQRCRLGNYHNAEPACRNYGTHAAHLHLAVGSGLQRPHRLPRRCRNLQGADSIHSQACGGSGSWPAVAWRGHQLQLDIYRPEMG